MTPAIGEERDVQLRHELNERKPLRLVNE